MNNSFILCVLVCILAAAPDLSRAETSPRVLVLPVRYAQKLLEYEYYLDGRSVQLGQSLTNLKAGMMYRYTVLDEEGRLVYSNELSFSEGKSYKLYSSETWEHLWYPRIQVLGGSMLGGGADYFLSRYSWLGGGSSFSFWYRRDYNAAFLVINPYLEYGTYYVGDRMAPFRLGMGGRVQAHFVLPYTNWVQVVGTGDEEITDSNPSSLSLDIFLSLEYRIWTASLALRLDFFRPDFQLLPALGIKF